MKLKDICSLEDNIQQTFSSVQSLSHVWLNGHEFEWTPGDSGGQRSLMCCSPWGCKESDTTEWLNWTEGTKRWIRFNSFQSCQEKRGVKQKTARHMASFWKIGIFHFPIGCSPEPCPHSLRFFPTACPLSLQDIREKEEKVLREGILEGGKASKALGNSHDIWHLKILD